MKKIIFLLLSLVSSLSSFATGRRGETFEKDGVIYTIISEFLYRGYDNENQVRKGSKTLLNRGEVYVSGVSPTLKGVVRIPKIVKNPSSYCRVNEVVDATYLVLGIGEKAFEGANFQDLILPGGLKFISKEAFHNLKLESEVLVVPRPVVMKANVFDGLNTRVLLSGSSKYEQTFQNVDSIPEIYVSHSDYNLDFQGMDKKLLYTVGENACSKWVHKDTLRNRYRNIPRPYVRPYDKVFPNLQFSFVDGGVDFGIWPAKKYEKLGSDLDLIAPAEYRCSNSYDQDNKVFQELVVNETIYRGKNGDKYFYYALDGKPITDVSSLVDDSGKDPFGLQVFSAEEMKAKKAVKEREQNLNKKVNNLKNLFGM